MPLKQNKSATMTAVLRQAISDCELSFHELERQTGLKRQSLMKFTRGEQSLRLDLADKLAEFFRLELRPTKIRRKAK